MRKYGKWALTLGLLAAAPAWSVNARPAQAAEESAAKQENQQVANDIAQALRAARVSGKGLAIEYKGGVASLTGEVADARMKARAEQAASRVPGVQAVSNDLVVAGKAEKKSVSERLGAEAAPGKKAPATAAAKTRQPANAARPRASTPTWVEQDGGVQQASQQVAAGARPKIQQVSGEIVQASMEDNQAMAEQIAGALSAAQLDGYDIGIRYQNGVATLEGKVQSAEQRAMAERVVSSVPGVRGINNQLMAPGAPQGPMMRPGMPMGPGAPMMGPNGMPVRPAGYPVEGMGAPVAGPGYAPAGTGMGAPIYNSPSLPDHAWPAYAQYPNSAAVNYPQQYSASAWPYIGPFYPYPQVPLGWRDATLRWDDGQWNLQFRQRTDHWWWFLHPKNWE